MAKFTYKGINIEINAPYTSGNVIKTLEKKNRFYELKFLEYISSLDMGGLYVDVGANIGTHTIYFAQFCNSDKVIAIEPIEAVFDQLKDNLKKNKLLKKVDLKQMAAGEKNGFCSIEEDANDPLSSSSVTEGDDIEMKMLDDIVGSQKVSMIKVDVEGTETSVLEGAKKILKRDKPELFLEAATADERRRIEAIIKPFGYQSVKVYNNTATYHYSTSVKRNPMSYAVTSPYVIRRLIRNS